MMMLVWEEEGLMTTVPCDVVQEFEVPPGVAAIRIEAESRGAGGHSSSVVTLQIRPGATLRLRYVCLPAKEQPRPDH
jgi:hypothetical protein